MIKKLVELLGVTKPSTFCPGGRTCAFTGHRPQNLPFRFNESDKLRTPPQQCSLTADDGASLPLEWCMATGGVVHRAAMLRTTRGCPCVCAWIHPQSGWYRRCR